MLQNTFLRDYLELGCMPESQWAHLTPESCLYTHHHQSKAGICVPPPANRQTSLACQGHHAAESLLRGPPPPNTLVSSSTPSVTTGSKWDFMNYTFCCFWIVYFCISKMFPCDLSSCSCFTYTLTHTYLYTHIYMKCLLFGGLSDLVSGLSGCSVSRPWLSGPPVSVSLVCSDHDHVPPHRV